MRILLQENKPGVWTIEVGPTMGETDAPTTLDIVKSLHAVQGDLLRQIAGAQGEKKKPEGTVIQMPTAGQISDVNRGPHSG